MGKIWLIAEGSLPILFPYFREKRPFFEGNPQFTPWRHSMNLSYPYIFWIYNSKPFQRCIALKNWKTTAREIIFSQRVVWVTQMRASYFEPCHMYYMNYYMNYAWKNFTKIKKIKIMKPFIITLAIKLFLDGRGDLDFTFYKMSIVFHCFSFRLFLICYKGERDTSKFKTFINNTRWVLSNKILFWTAGCLKF